MKKLIFISILIFIVTSCCSKDSKKCQNREQQIHYRYKSGDIVYYKLDSTQMIVSHTSKEGWAGMSDYSCNYKKKDGTIVNEYFKDSELW